MGRTRYRGTGAFGVVLAWGALLLATGRARGDEVGARHEVTLSASGAGYLFVNPVYVNGGNQRGGRYSAGADYTLLLRPLQDDGMPLSLQRFVQRTPTLTLSLSARGFRTLVGDGPQGGARFTYRSDGVRTSIGSVFYPVEAVRLGLGASIEYDVTGYDDRSTSAAPTFAVNPWIQVGLRRQQAEVYFQYGFHPRWSSGTLAPIGPGSFTLVAQGVVGKLLWLSGHLGYSRSADGGIFSTGMTVEVFPRTSLGIYLGQSVQRGNLYVNSTGAYDAYATEVGVGWWLRPRLALVPWVELDVVRGTADEYRGWVGVSLHLRW